MMDRAILKWDRAKTFELNPEAYIDVAVGGKLLGRLRFELYEDAVPYTVANFLALATGSHEMKVNGRKMHPHYQGTALHRIVPDFIIQGGDVIDHNGTGSLSIYGRTFPDESFVGKAGAHDGFGTLSMANSGPNTNGSQFFISLAEAPYLNGKHVVFGKLLEGKDVIARIASYGTESGKPKAPLYIVDCGQINLLEQKRLEKEKGLAQAAAAKKRNEGNSNLLGMENDTETADATRDEGSGGGGDAAGAGAGGESKMAGVAMLALKAQKT